MAEAILDVHSREYRKKSSVRMGLCSLLLIMIITISSILGVLYVFKIITESSGSAYPQCQFVKLNGVEGEKTTRNRGDGTDQDSPIITISLLDNEQWEVTSNDLTASEIDTPSSLNLLSGDNRVKLSLSGAFFITDGVQNVDYRLDLGDKGIVNNRLDEFIPKIEIIFNCGMITMYFTEYKSRNFIYMMTGELANGHLRRELGNFLWRTSDVQMKFPTEPESHYYCNQSVQFEPIIYQDNEAHKIRFQINELEYEINRNPVSDPESFSTRRGYTICDTL